MATLVCGNMAHSDPSSIRSFAGNKEMLPIQPSFPNQPTPQVMYSAPVNHPMCNIVPSGYPMVQNRFYTQPPFQPPLMGTFRPVVPIAGQLGVARGTIPNIRSPVPQELRRNSPTAQGTGSYLEEQKKLEKERNFQVQQQRLKQFSVSGRKTNLTPGYLESLFGSKTEKKQSSPSDQAAAALKHEQEKSQKVLPQNFLPKEEVVTSCKPSESEKENYLAVETKEQPKHTNTDAKALDNMMNECFDLSRPPKAKTFQKPSVKEIQPVAQQTKNFSSSEKACNWKSIEIEKLQDIFTLPKPRFPNWCQRQYVPPLYIQVEEECTAHGSKPIDTAQLYPILTSSGLQRELLGQIWEICNQTTPGQLTQQELYTVLALIALVQMGHPSPSIDDLHALQHPVVPVLQYFMYPPSARVADTTKMQMAEQRSAEYPKGGSLPVEASFPQTQSGMKTQEMPPPATFEQPVITATAQKTDVFKSENTNKGSFENEALDFGEFKSAMPLPSAAETLHSKSIEQNKDDSSDEFAEFQQASMTHLTTPFNSNIHLVQQQSNQSNKLFSQSQDKKFEQDLMSPEEEDKYSIFRTLESVPSDSSKWGFEALHSDKTSDKHISSETDQFSLKESKSLQMSNTETQLSDMNAKEPTDTEDEFGDFLTAEANVSPAKDEFTDFASFDPGKTEEFCDFASFQTDPTPAVTVSDNLDDFSMISVSSHITGQSRADTGLDVVLSSQSKDSVSLAESQSVSSLELGTFDSAVPGGRESKSSLSRHGSIPSLDFKVSLTRQGSAHSLDLKGSTLDHGDEEFGEMKSYSVSRKISSHSPSPSFDISKGSEEDLPVQPPQSSRALFQQATPFTITDRYSFIRMNEKDMQEDSHVSEWLRCLQSCNNLIHNANEIFNQMNSSTVCNQVIGTEEGSNYIKNLVEIYRVAKRIETSVKATGKETDQLCKLLKDIDHSWSSLSVFIAHSSIMCDETSMDFTSGTLRYNSENQQKACGVCLLNVDTRSKAFDREEDCYKLTYGGRQYHASCANFWVNCVDPLLPALQLPQLL